MHTLFINLSICFPEFNPFIIIFPVNINPKINSNIFFISTYLIFLQYFLKILYISSAENPHAYKHATILPEDVPPTQSNFIFASSNAFIAPICAAPFTPPPAKHNPFFIKTT